MQQRDGIDMIETISIRPSVQCRNLDDDGEVAIVYNEAFEMKILEDSHQDTGYNNASRDAHQARDDHLCWTSIQAWWH